MSPTLENLVFASGELFLMRSIRLLAVRLRHLQFNPCMDMADSSADDDWPGSRPRPRPTSFSWDIGGNMVDDILSTSWYLLLVCVANNAGNDDAGDVVVDVVGAGDELDSEEGSIVVVLAVVAVSWGLWLVDVVPGRTSYAGLFV